MGQASKLLVLYGSVTGKAQSIAEQVAERAGVEGWDVLLAGLGEVGKTWLLEEASTMVIVSSTTGDGEQPENVIKFWRKMRPKTLSASHLGHVQYALLGLGDTNYSSFCAAPQALHRRLGELGARCLLAPAWADDGTGLEEVVEPWLDSLWPALASTRGGELEAGLADLAIGTEETKVETEYKLPPCPASYLTVSYRSPPACPQPTLPLPPLPSAASPLLPATLTSCTLLTSPLAAKHYYCAELKLEQELTYRAGDSVALVCQNSEQELEQARTRLQLEEVWHQECLVAVDPDTTKKKASLPSWLPPQATPDTLFRHHLDIRAVPKKTLVR